MAEPAFGQQESLDVLRHRGSGSGAADNHPAMSGVQTYGTRSIAIREGRTMHTLRLQGILVASATCLLLTAGAGAQTADLRPPLTSTTSPA